jgi:hypothetical protein
VAIRTSAPLSMNALLLLEADAADQERLVELVVLGVELDVISHLRRQLAGRRQHQRARHAGAGAAARQALDHGQGEGCGLAGAGLGDAQHVAPGERNGNGALLDRGGLFVTSVSNS